VLSERIIPLGREVTATGQGCTPGAPVGLSVGRTPVGFTEADQNGNFTTTVFTSALGAGQGQVTANCGPTLAAPLSVILISHGGAGPGVMMVFVYFVMFAIWMYVRAWHPTPY
jgi:hypothetical protein